MTAFEAPPAGIDRPKAAVVICTRDRPGELAAALCCVAQDRPGSCVVVYDASAGEATAGLCSASELPLDLHYVRAERPGLARQRNDSALYCRRLGVEIVHFIDDDTRIRPGYQEAIEARLAAEKDLAGVGAVVENQPVPSFKQLKRLFGLWGPVPGSVLKSGRAVMGQYPGGPDGGRLDWLSGCAMSYRLDVVLRHRFDDRLEGYSKAEDKDFGFRVSRSGRLAVETRARCVHDLSPANRWGSRRHAYEATVIVAAWAAEQAGNGISRLAFAWSAAGDACLRVGLGLARRDKAELSRALGTVQALGRIAIGRLSSPACRPLAEVPADPPAGSPGGPTPAGSTPAVPRVPALAPRLVYVAGSMRSGSTLVGELLGSFPGAVAVGELNNAALPTSLGQRCSCGAEAVDCPVWAMPTAKLLTGEERRRVWQLRRGVERQRRLVELVALARRPPSSWPADVAEYADWLRSLVDLLLEGSGASTLVDSSKSATGLAIMRLALGEQIAGVHLLRDPRAVAWSESQRPHERDAQTTAPPPVRSTLSSARGYATANLECRLVAGRVMHSATASYEALCAEPAAELARLGALLGLEGGGPRFEGATVGLATSHVLAGNPSRTAGNRRVVRLDDGWRRAMPAGSQLLTGLIAGPVAVALKRGTGGTTPKSGRA
ncbi:MAG: glycosyltransferase family 2 protein [Acidimicrobiales bacterium]